MESERMPHDASYKEFFSSPDMVRSLLTSFIPEDFVAELDLSTLERCSGDYITEDMRERRSDIVWRIAWKDGRWCYLILLLEFQSSMDHWMALRVLSYTTLFLLDLVKTGKIKDGEGLPPVFPVVIYNGGRAWTAPMEVNELFAPMPESLKKYSPRQRHFLLDEGRVSQESLAQDDNLVSLLIALETAEDIDPIRDAVGKLIGCLKNDKYRALRRAFAVWLGRVVIKRAGIQDDVSGIHELEEMNAMLEENVVHWKDRYIQQGRIAGLAEGRDAGRAEERREIVARMLRNNLTKSQIALFLSMSDAELDDLIAQASRN